MRLTWSSTVPDAGSLREHWDALVLRMEKPEVFYTWEWSAAVAHAYRETLRPLIVTAYEGDELVGVAAFGRSSSGRAEFLAGTTADYCDFVSAPAHRQEFADTVLNELARDGVEQLALANLPADSLTRAVLDRCKMFRQFSRTGYVCAQVQLGSPEEKQMLRASLRRKKMLQRALKRLTRIGPVSLRDHRHPDIRSDLDRFYTAHVARFLATGRLCNLVSRERREFLTELAQLLSTRGWFALTSLCVGDRIVASNYGFRYAGSWFWYQPTIVNEFQEHSPGLCLLGKMLESACEDASLERLDLGLGAEGYKERFANTARTTLHCTLARRAVPLWKAKARFRAAEFAKARPPVEALARKLQQATAHGRDRVRTNGWRDLARWIGARALRVIARRDDVRLYRWPDDADRERSKLCLAPLTWDHLARAAMRYAGEQETLTYLLRASKRFPSETSKGYALLGIEGFAEHFAWVAPYDGFYVSEIGETLHTPIARSVMIFDCWTPKELRGRGLFSSAIQQLAQVLGADGKEVWIFAAAENHASLAGIVKAGFEAKLLLVRRFLVGTTRMRRITIRTDSPASATMISTDAVR